MRLSDPSQHPRRPARPGLALLHLGLRPLRLRLAPSVLVALATATLACTPPEPTEHAGHGVALEVDREKRTVTLDHGEIPGLMQAMTMTFDVAPGVELGSLEPDTPVDFTLRSQGQSLTLTEIRPAATP